MSNQSTYKQFQADISRCFNELSMTMYHHASSVALYDQYLDRLYTDDGDINYDEWNEDTLNSMKSDITKLKTQVRDRF